MTCSNCIFCTHIEDILVKKKKRMHSDWCDVWPCLWLRRFWPEAKLTCRLLVWEVTGTKKMRTSPLRLSHCSGCDISTYINMKNSSQEALSSCAQQMQFMSSVHFKEAPQTPVKFKVRFDIFIFVLHANLPQTGCSLVLFCWRRRRLGGKCGLHGHLGQEVERWEKEEERAAHKKSNFYAGTTA